MLLDPTDQFIESITVACPVDGTTLLEIGCGSGRITRDLASRAREVVAIDPDQVALRRARAVVTGANVRFVQARAEALELPGCTFDVAIFSLSLHHVPPEKMGASLLRVARHVRPGGRMVVIEPGDEGTLIDAEMRFDVGDGDERAAKAAAQEALRRIPAWRVEDTSAFRTLFHFRDVADFVDHLPARAGQPAPYDELSRFLESHRDGDRIVLWSSRRLTVLAREVSARSGFERSRQARVRPSERTMRRTTTASKARAASWGAPRVPVFASGGEREEPVTRAAARAGPLRSGEDSRARFGRGLAQPNGIQRD